MSLGMKDYEEMLYMCAKCGYCRVDCPIRKIKGFETSSPRAIFLLVKHFKDKNEELPPELIEIIYQCTTCGLCKETCPIELDIPEIIRSMRIDIVKEQGKPVEGFVMATENVLSVCNPLGRARRERCDWVPDDVKIDKDSPNLFFAGCMSSYWEMYSAELATRIFNRINYSFKILEDEPCCGYLECWSGEEEVAKKIARENVERFKSEGISTIITSCPGCYSTLKEDYPRLLGKETGIEVLHISELFAKLIDEKKLRFEQEQNISVTYHDPCHLGRFHGIYDAPRKIIKSLPGITFIEMENIREESNCCGGPLRTAYLDYAQEIGKNRAIEIADTGAEFVTTICPQCVISLRQVASLNELDFEVIDLIVLIARGLGIEEAEDYF
ncbi:MAG: (Fe-S)-binding protein [Candidatus Helarchaeota archaeon]